MTNPFSSVWIMICISTHILTRRMTHILHFCSLHHCISTHILTRRMTFYSASYYRKYLYFNSHPHEEDDFDVTTIQCKQNHFNSHPHEEDDGMNRAKVHIAAGISTHILTRRMTTAEMKQDGTLCISTHILTRRMTAILNKNNPFKITYYINNKHFISIVDIFFHFHIYFQA